MIRLIVSDLDGTLLNDKHEVPARFWKIAPRLFEKGIKLGIATGRPHFSITEKFQSIVNEIYCISDNGALILHDDKVVLSKPLPHEEIEALVLASRPIPDAWPVLCGQDLWYIEDEEDVLIENISIYHKNFVVVDDLTKVEDGILKMSIFDRVGAQENSYLHYKSFEDRLKIAAGGKVWLDITRTDANKGAAVRMLQEIVGISADETLVFGDFMNDYEMMQAATYSYAMKNAYPKILEVARFVTEKDNNDGGVVDVIEKLCLAE